MTLVDSKLSIGKKSTTFNKRALLNQTTAWLELLPIPGSVALLQLDVAALNRKLSRAKRSKQSHNNETTARAIQYLEQLDAKRTELAVAKETAKTPWAYTTAQVADQGNTASCGPHMCAHMNVAYMAPADSQPEFLAITVPDGRLLRRLITHDVANKLVTWL